MVSLTDDQLRRARARIAVTVLPPVDDEALGSIHLRSEQRMTAARVHGVLAAHGGCLLADEMGTGKTFVALAVARRWQRPLAVVPASLRSLWREESSRADVECTIVSHERLGIGWTPTAPFDGLLVDESHRFRSTSTRRYAALTALATRAPLLLLSATPLQNRLRDLAAQIALFHGARAHQLDARSLARFIVRGDARGRDDLPRVAPPRWVRPVADDGAVLEALLALPPPPLPRGGADALVLRSIGLVRAWASSRAALRASLRQRRRVATGIEQSALDGFVPTSSELRSWQAVDDTIQLGFPAVLVDGSADVQRIAPLLEAARRELGALAAVGRLMASGSDPDVARVQMLRIIRAEHPGQRVLVFSERAATVRGFFAMLRGDAGVGLLTSTDARIASGRLATDELLSRFAPHARRLAPPAPREDVTLLLATDLLSEGVNLQDASVVVHLDLPWNPARLAQRVGRLRRPGGASEVQSLLVLPPARAELLLAVERRLRLKLAEASRAIGRGIDVVPGLVPTDESIDAGEAVRLGETASILSRWRRASMEQCTAGSPVCAVAGARSAQWGWLAMLDDGRLIASVESSATDDAHAVATAVTAADGAPAPLADDTKTAAIVECQRWLDASALRRDCGASEGIDALDAAIERRVAQVLGRAPRHERPVLLGLASRIRSSLGHARSLGAELALRASLHRQRPRTSAADLAWLAETAELAASTAHRGRYNGERPGIVALIALVPDVQSD